MASLPAVEPGGPPDGAGGPHVFVDSLDRPVLDDGDAHHLARVLRIRPGDPITVGDGRGRWCAAVFGSEVELVGSVIEVAPPTPVLTIGFVVPKGDRPAWIVQKLTELGVDRIQLLSSQRSVVRWDPERGAKHLARLRTVARSAAMQSRQTRVPVIEPMRPIDALLAEGGVALAHRGGQPPSLHHPTVLVGPEGGWDGTELQSSAPLVNLGSSVLRAETAAVVAGSTLSLLRSGLVIEHLA